MSSHLFNITVELDDESIREGIIKSCEKEIVSNFKKEFYDTDYYGRATRPGSQLTDIVDRRVAEVVEANKDDIISLIVERASDKIIRSKAFKDKLKSNKEKEDASDE